MHVTSTAYLARIPAGLARTASHCLRCFRDPFASVSIERGDLRHSVADHDMLSQLGDGLDVLKDVFTESMGWITLCFWTTDMVS